MARLAALTLFFLLFAVCAVDATAARDRHKQAIAARATSASAHRGIQPTFVVKAAPTTKKATSKPTPTSKPKPAPTTKKPTPAKPTSTKKPVKATSTPKPKPKPKPTSTKPKPKPSSTTKKPVAKPTSTKKPAPKPTTTKKPAPKPTTTKKPAPKPTTTKKPAPKPTSTKPAPKPTSSPKPAQKPRKACLAAIQIVGLLWTPDSGIKLNKWKNNRTLAIWNWDRVKPAEIAASGIPFWPTLWGPGSAPGWLETVNHRGYADTALGCNEVNQPGQALMTVQEGTYLWRNFMMPLKKNGYRLLSHSVSSAPSGLTWLLEWKKDCPDCWATVDALSLHYYSPDADGFIAYMKNMHAKLGKPIMVTETACEDFSGEGRRCSPAQAEAYLNKITKWMDETDWIHGYFYFGLWANPPGGVSSSNSLMNADGTPNRLGLKYIGS
ncbi:hypothetical protein AURDEDRAFT_179225 [Auricularia subglabra TFB-10046 SS5]|nr:hypothetical protein AURDEDRAFT_179225 [Auricularia subglabra TFB-10046 SS5]